MPPFERSTRISGTSAQCGETSEATAEIAIEAISRHVPMGDVPQPTFGASGAAIVQRSKFAFQRLCMR